MVEWRLALWVLLSAVGVVVIALPDDDDRLFSISAAHGPSPVDSLGIGIVLVGFALFVSVLWAHRAAWGRLPRRTAHWVLFLVGFGSGLIIASVASDWPQWWLVGVGIIGALQFVAAWRVLRGGPVPA